jgi:hypothetical protein
MQFRLVRGPPDAKIAIMRALIALGAVLFVASGCASQTATPAATITDLSGQVSPDNPHCRDYTATATVGAQRFDLAGHACLSPDGNWTIVEGPKGDPAHAQTIHFPTAYGYFYDGAWQSWPPIGLSLRPPASRG